MGVVVPGVCVGGGEGAYQGIEVIIVVVLVTNSWYVYGSTGGISDGNNSGNNFGNGLIQGLVQPLLLCRGCTAGGNNNGDSFGGGNYSGNGIT